MTRGRLDADLTPYLPITLHGTRDTTIDAIVDTGFSEHLCLARRLRRRMSLIFLGWQSFELADGRTVREPVYEGEVTFDGARQRVLVTVTRSADTLVGTALLKGKQLTVNFHSGEVIVEDATSPRDTP